MYGIIETSTLIISTTPTESYGYGLIRIGELVADSVFFDGGALFYQDAPVITRSATDTLLFFNMTGHVHSLRILKMFFDAIKAKIIFTKSFKLVFIFLRSTHIL